MRLSMQSSRERPVLDVARVTVEALSPLSVTTGVASDVFDTALVRDADGLPALPASSIAGVLRSLAQDAYGTDWVEEVFGRTGRTAEEVLRSRIAISWARVHGSDDRPARPDAIASDELLRVLGPGSRLTPVVRERVRINARGVADAEGAGKFDRTVVPRGARFTFLIQWWSDGSPAESQRWADILALLRHPDLAIGGAVHSGLGRLKLVPPAGKTFGALLLARFDLRKEQDITSLAAARSKSDGALVDLRAAWPFRAPFAPNERAMPRKWPVWKLSLTPADFFRVGGGRGPVSDSVGKGADLRPMREPCVDWGGPVANRLAKDRLVVPGSGIKGALRHRTRFHLARCLDCFAGTATPEALEKLEDLDALLFGTAKGNEDGKPGVIIVDDVVVGNAGKAEMVHNSIDRFTGGVRDGFLFSEELVAGRSQLDVTIRFRSDVKGYAKWALKASLLDLGFGRLTLGGGSGRGHGRFRGKLQEVS